MKRLGRWDAQPLANRMNPILETQPTPSMTAASNNSNQIAVVLPNHVRPVRSNVDSSELENYGARPLQLRLLSWLVVMGLSALATSAQAQNFSIDWYTIDGGGGTSAGGNFSLSGTIGQPDAGVTMTNGGFALTGGFWSIHAVQTPGAPQLAITRASATSVRVSWPSPSPGFVLQEKSDLNAASWVNAPQAVSDDGTTRFVTVNPSNSRRFYRLIKP